MATREPLGTRGPLFELIRGATESAFAVRSDVPEALAARIGALVQDEPLGTELEPPRHAAEYRALLTPFSRTEWPGSRLQQNLGLAFEFPEMEEETRALDSTQIVEIHDEARLMRHFTGWIPGELAAGRTPAFAILDEEGHALSVCFCARRSEEAAEAGLETAQAYRRQGYGARVTAAWARAVRKSGRIPLYSSLAENSASRAVAAKLKLRHYATDWSISVKS